MNSKRLPWLIATCLCLSIFLSAASSISIRYPFAHNYPVSSPFGDRYHPISGTHRFHTGIDIAAPQGAAVLAVKSGTVIHSDWLGGYGEAIILEHENSNQQTLYAHLSSIEVSPGQVISAGNIIGHVGSTGQSTGPHLHLELREYRKNQWIAIDPHPHLGQAGPPTQAANDYVDITPTHCSVALFGDCFGLPRCSQTLFGGCDLE